MGFIIDKELKSLLKPLESEEYQQLEHSLLNEGCRDALILWNNIMIDGHNRYEICTRHGIKFETNQKHFDSYDAAKIWMIDNQLARRNLSDGWRLEYAMNKKDLLLAVGKEKQKETLKQFSGDTVLSLNDKTGDTHNTRDEIASDLGWSTGKVAQAEVVRKEAPELWEDVKSGEKTVGGAYQQARSNKPHVSNNSGDNEWYTPAEYIQAAVSVMGSIDLDPASTATANEIVGASTYFTELDNGLSQPWAGRVWLNPPYAKELIGDFIDKLVTSEDVTEAIVLVNNATETKWFNTLSSWSTGLCLPIGRVKFWHPSKVSSPLQGQAILYLGSNTNLFLKEFEEFGEVWRK